MSKRVLVTGGGGYIGSSMVRYLLICGYKVTVLDNLSMGSDGVMCFLGYPSYTFLKGDIREVAIVKEALNNVDYVIHLAAIVGEPACSKFPNDAKSINIEGTKILFDESIKSGVERFIFFSTCSSYGVQDTNTMANEKTDLNPVSLYAETKIEMEDYLIQNSNSQMSYTIMRPSTVHGVSPRMRFDLIVNHFVKDAFLNKKLDIFGRNLWRPIMWVGEAGRAVEKVLKSDLKIIHNQIYNLGNTSNNYRKSQIAEIIKSKFIPELEIKYEGEEEDLRSYKVDFSKIESELGFDLQKTLEQAIFELISLIDNNIISDIYGDKYKNH